MKRVAENKHQLVLEIPAIVGIVPIRVEPPPAVVIAFDVEHVRVAVGIGCVRDAFRATPHEFSKRAVSYSASHPEE